MTVPQTRTRESVEAMRGRSPVHLIVSKLEGGPWYTISEVHEITGIPESTIRRWYNNGPEKGGTKGPSHVHHQGDLPIYLWDDEDLAELKAKRETTKKRKA